MTAPTSAGSRASNTLTVGTSDEIGIVTESLAKTSIIMLAVPFSAVGAIWLLYLLGYNMSIGVWVGLIALMGVDAETGVFMLLYLDIAYEDAKQAGKLRNL